MQVRWPIHFQAREIRQNVAQVSNLLYRRLPVGKTPAVPNTSQEFPIYAANNSARNVGSYTLTPVPAAFVTNSTLRKSADIGSFAGGISAYANHHPTRPVS